MRKPVEKATLSTYIESILEDYCGYALKDGYTTRLHFWYSAIDWQRMTSGASHTSLCPARKRRQVPRLYGSATEDILSDCMDAFENLRLR